MNKYNLTPIEAAQAKKIEIRDTHTIVIHWLYFPVAGKNYRHYLKQKAHIETQIRWLAVLSTDELYRVVLAIQNQDVPSFFSEIVNTIYQTKKQGQHVIEISVGDNVNKMPLFDYNDSEKWNNPLLPKNKEIQSGPASLMLPKKPKVPTLPMQQVPPNVVKMLKNLKKG